MELDKAKIEEALARGLALLMEKETAHAFRSKQWGGRAWKPSNISANLLINSSMLRWGVQYASLTKGKIKADLKRFVLFVFHG